MFFQALSSIIWLKDKHEAFAQKLVEVVQSHNQVSEKFNELKSSADLLKSENTRLSKSLKEAETTIFVREAELKKVEQKAEYYEDKSSSMKMYTTVKIYAEMKRQFLDGKASSWDTKASFKSWEKMKTLYSKSEGENEHQEASVEPTGTSGNDPSGQKDGSSGSGVVEEEVVVEDIVEGRLISFFFSSSLFFFIKYSNNLFLVLQMTTYWSVQIDALFYANLDETG